MATRSATSAGGGWCGSATTRRPVSAPTTARRWGPKGDDPPRRRPRLHRPRPRPRPRAAALAELVRVLRPEGGLALLWNARDESAPWVAEFTRVIDWHNFQQGHYRAQDWAAVVAGSSSRFTPVEHATFAYEQRLDRAGF